MSSIPARPKVVRVVLNSASGSAQTPALVEAALQSAGVDAKIHSVSGADLRHALAGYVECDAVVAGGGDGTISAAAQVLAGTATPLGVLPLGTLNHFAKDLGIPADLDDAAAVIARGVIREVDVGEVNGEIFINNSSIGFYARAVEIREARQQHLGWSKWPAMAYAMARLLYSLPRLRIKVSIPGQSARLNTPFVFVGNNHYQTTPGSIGERARLDKGELFAIVAKASGALGLLRLVWHAARGRLDESRDCEIFSVCELTLDSKRSALHVARDGEVGRMQPPLHYRSRPRALKVIVPG